MRVLQRLTGWILCSVGRHDKKVHVKADDINVTMTSCARNCGWSATVKYHASENASGKG